MALLLDPVGVVNAQAQKPVRPLTGLQGRRIGFRTMWTNFEEFCGELEDHFRQQFGVEHVERWHEVYEKHKVMRSRASQEGMADRDRIIQGFVQRVDAAVVGLGA